MSLQESSKTGEGAQHHKPSPQPPPAILSIRFSLPPIAILKISATQQRNRPRNSDRNILCILRSLPRFPDFRNSLLRRYFHSLQSQTALIKLIPSLHPLKCCRLCQM